MIHCILSISAMVPLTLGCIAATLFLLLLGYAAVTVFRNRKRIQKLSSQE